jgi:hypothetical protein
MVSVTRPTAFHVGAEHVTVDWTYDACPNQCMDDAGNPFATVDPDSTEANEKRRTEAWLSEYGHLPPPPPPYVVIHARIPPSLAARLDQARGAQSRSMFLRIFLSEHLTR